MPKATDPRKRKSDEVPTLSGPAQFGRPRPSPLRVLLVEADEATAATVSHHFTDQGVSVTHAVDGPASIQALRERAIDIVVLELALPGPDGLEVCRQIREQSDLPIVILSGRSAEADRLAAFDVGADDFVPKPFSVRELLARVSAFVRRVRGEVVSLKKNIVVDDVTLEPGALRASRNGRDLGLTSYEFNILYALAERRGRVCTREHLIESAGGVAEGAFERSIDVHVSRVRQKLGDDARQPQVLKTVRGTGYLFARPSPEE